MDGLLRYLGSEAVLSYSQNVDGGIGIAVYGQAAHRTQVPSIGEFLFGATLQPVRAVAAPRTILRRVRRIDGNYLTPGTFSLRREDGAELRPGSISNKLGEVVVAEHILDAQFFDSNHSKTVDDAPSVLVAEIMAAVTDALMDAGNDLAGLAPFCIAEL